MSTFADLILHNADITTLDHSQPSAQALAIKDGKFIAVGNHAEVLRHAGPSTRVIDAQQHHLIPGLIDSHTHLIRGGLNYNLELRWDGLTSLADGMQLLKAQVARTPAPQWVRVVGGFTEHQFTEKRLPTLNELNAIAPDTPVFILHLYDRALLNGAALRAVGYTKDTPNPPGSEIVRDANGNPTGLLLAKPNALLLYSALAKGPKLPFDYQLNSTRHFMRDLNRLGVTSVIDAGGGFQNYPDDYQVIADLHQANQLTVRIAYNLFTQKPKEEVADFTRWTSQNDYHQGDDFYKLNGAGEMLVFSAADFEDFRQPRPDLIPDMDAELESVVRILAAKRWPWRLHATYDESISRALDVFEKVHQDIPIDGINWFFDHAETVSDRNLERIARLGGGVAIQHRMAYQGEYFVERYGTESVKRSPPFKRMLEMGVHVGAGTDATRVASYDPWNVLYWLTTGKTLGGLSLYPESNLLTREQALRLYTCDNTWFSNEEGLKGQIKVGQLADATLLSASYFKVSDEDIRQIVSVMTLVNGRIVYADGPFKPHDTPLPPAMPDWSPVNFGSQYWKTRPTTAMTFVQKPHCTLHQHHRAPHMDIADHQGFWGAFGCSCWVF